MTPPHTGFTEIIDRYEPLLGTTIEIRVRLSGVARESEADALSEAMIAEIARLQSVLSSVDDASEFRRWAVGAVDDVSAELAEVLIASAEWQVRSQGRFSPAVGRLSALWSDAARAGIEPDAAELARVVGELAAPRWRIEHSGGERAIVRLADASDCTVNAIAKGWIADAAVRHALAAGTDGIELVSVNAGGDIAHAGTVPLVVGIEDPHLPLDNGSPIAVVELRGAGLATSGGAHRGFVIGGRRHSHVIDPRSGQPLDDLASITVVAPDCMTADVLCTTLGMLPPVDALAEADAFGVACLIVDAHATNHANEAWDSLAHARPTAATAAMGHTEPSGSNSSGTGSRAGGSAGAGRLS